MSPIESWKVRWSHPLIEAVGAGKLPFVTSDICPDPCAVYRLSSIWLLCYAPYFVFSLFFLNCKDEVICYTKDGRIQGTASSQGSLFLYVLFRGALYNSWPKLKRQYFTMEKHVSIGTNFPPFFLSVEIYFYSSSFQHFSGINREPSAQSKWWNDSL